MAKKFILEKGPYIRAVDEGKTSTMKIMVDLLIALIPIIIFAWFKHGLQPFFQLENVSFLTMIWPLLFVIIGGLSSFLFEAVYFACFKKIQGFRNIIRETNLSSAVIPGILLALIMPVYTPLWILMLGCLIANVIIKLLYGGFGFNIFNPALIAYAILMAAFAGTLNNAYFGPMDGLSTMTPLANYAQNIGAGKEILVDSYGGMLNFFIGTIPGSLGETSSLLIIVAFIYLTFRKVINPTVPVIYVGVVFIITWIVGVVNGQAGIWYPTFNILSGGLLFGAVFMATEPVTTPKSPNGKIIFAVGLGVLTCLFRLVGSMPEGVATSILFMCLFTPVIDRFASVARSSKLNTKIALKYALIVVLFLGISAYTIVKCTPVKAEEPEGVVINNTTQELNNDLKIKVDFSYKGENKIGYVLVDLNGNYTISSVEIDSSDEEDFLSKVKSKHDALNVSTILGYSEETLTNGEEGYVITVRSKNSYVAIKTKYQIEKATGKIINFELLSTNNHTYDKNQAFNSHDFGLMGCTEENYQNSFINLAEATVSCDSVKDAAKVSFALYTILNGGENNG